MKRGKFDITVLTLGFAFLYIPIIILIGLVLAALSASFAIRRWLRA